MKLLKNSERYVAEEKLTEGNRTIMLTSGVAFNSIWRLADSSAGLGHVHAEQIGNYHLEVMV